MCLDRVLRGDMAGRAKLKLRILETPRRRRMVLMGAVVLADIMKDQAGF